MCASFCVVGGSEVAKLTRLGSPDAKVLLPNLQDINQRTTKVIVPRCS